MKTLHLVKQIILEVYKKLNFFFISEEDATKTKMCCLSVK